MKKINKQPAFSLMEVMVILLIMAVTLAATAPMISRKMSRNVGTAEEPWKFTGIGNDISFNSENRDRTTVLIGTDRIGRSYLNNNVSRLVNNLRPSLYIKSFGNNREVIGFAQGSDGALWAVWSQNGDVDSNGNPIAWQNGGLTAGGDNNNRVPQADQRAAIAFSTRYNANDINEGPNQNNNNSHVEAGWTRNNFLYGYLGMANINGNGFPFLSNKIPSTEGLLLGNRLQTWSNRFDNGAMIQDNSIHVRDMQWVQDVDAQGNPVLVYRDVNVNQNGQLINRSNISYDNITNKVIMGYDNHIRDVIGGANNGPRNGLQFGNTADFVLLGSDFNPDVTLRTVAIGRGIRPGNVFNCWWTDAVAIANNGTPALMQNDGVQNFYALAYEDDGRATFQDLNNLDTRGQNNNDTTDGRVDGLTSIGPNNYAGGDFNTLLGRFVQCGTTIHQNLQVNAMPVSYGVAIGSGTNIYNGQRNNNWYGKTYAGGSFSVAIGSNAVAGLLGRQNNRQNRRSSVAIGPDALAASQDSIAIGRDARTNDPNQLHFLNNGNNLPNISNNSIAIGENSQCYNSNFSIAIGINAKVEDSTNGIAIGNGAKVDINNQDSVAIGSGVETDDDNQIRLGTAAHTVVIPGTLHVNSLQHNNRSIPAAELQSAITNLNNNLSDIRLKNVGEKLTSGLEDIKKLEFFNYTFKDDKEQKPHVGVMAQDLQKVFPTSVTEGSDGYLRIRWDEMFYAALNAIKELDRKIIALAEDVKSFFERVDSIDLRVAQHQKALDDLKSDFADIDMRLKALEE